MSTSNQDSGTIATPIKDVAKALEYRESSADHLEPPEFSFIDFFSGRTRTSGWFCDRFGKPRRHFSGNFYGTLSGSVLELHEELRFTDGITEQRTWLVTVSQEGIFTAESDTLIGRAAGLAKNDTLYMEYQMSVLIEKDKYWKLDMKDTMILQPDGVLHNLTHVYKWGVRIGSVSAMYVKETD